MTDLPRDAATVLSSGFGARLAALFETDDRLCVGIDPHPYLLSEWDLADDAAGLREFGLRVVDAAAGTARIVKPQVAFFERHGSAGYAALEEVLAAARAAGLLVIADVKRGDVGTSVEAYGQAWLTPGSPLEADAITTSAYQGLGSLDPVLALADAAGKGVFVLAATSNPEAKTTQAAVLSSGGHGGRTVAAGIVAEVMERNEAAADALAAASAPASATGSLGVVIGATVSLRDFGISPEELAQRPSTPILAPGFGHQGATFADLGRLFGAAAPTTIVSASRSILSAGPSGIGQAVREQVQEVRACLV